MPSRDLEPGPAEGTVGSRRQAAAGIIAVLLGLLAPGASAQEPPPVGREAALELEFPALEFDPPEVERHVLARDVPVVFLRDPTFPLVTLYARFEGGYSHFGRENYAAGMSVPLLLRYGGTTTLSPDSVDKLLEHYAFQTSFGGGGEGAFSRLNTLTEHLEKGLELWGAMLREPGFDEDEVEVWRGRELESVRRRKDDPTRLAFSEFNHLMYGDHPTGWEMNEEDLAPEKLARERLEGLHRQVFCPERLVLGVTGDVEWEEVEPLLEEMLEDWASCSEPLPDLPEPQIRREPGVFLIPRDLSQSTVVMAHPTDLQREDTPRYYASRIGNSILGASGFTSRILSRVRTEAGYAYSASSLWTTPVKHEGLVGAVTQTRAERTIAAVRLILEVMEEMTREPPSAAEVRTAVEEIVNGFVFNFENPSRIVSRQITYEAQGLPSDWLESWLDGIQEVTPEAVHQVFRSHLRPHEMTILILGDPQEFDEAPETLGDVRIWDVEGLNSPGEPSPDESPRSRR